MSKETRELAANIENTAAIQAYRTSATPKPHAGEHTDAYAETTHAFLECCARLLQDHSCEQAASEVLRSRKYIPNVPLAITQRERKLIDSLRVLYAHIGWKPSKIPAWVPDSAMQTLRDFGQLNKFNELI